jgi:hypothetical protein
MARRAVRWLWLWLGFEALGGTASAGGLPVEALQILVDGPAHVLLHRQTRESTLRLQPLELELRDAHREGPEFAAVCHDFGYVMQYLEGGKWYRCVLRRILRKLFGGNVERCPGNVKRYIGFFKSYVGAP